MQQKHEQQRSSEIRRQTHVTSSTQSLAAAARPHQMSVRRSLKRPFRPFDPEEFDLINQIDVHSSPVSKNASKYEMDVMDQIDESSPFKSTPQEQLIALIEESTPVKSLSAEKYEVNPDIEIMSPIKPEPNEVEMIETSDSRYFQLGKEKKRRSCRKSLLKDMSLTVPDTGCNRLLVALREYLSNSTRERNAFFREADDIDEKDSSGTKSRKFVEMEIAQAEFAVFGKCVIDGQIVKVSGFDEEQTFEMEDQRLRLNIDDCLANKFASHLESGRRIRVYYPFTLVQDQHSDYIMYDFFFIKALKSNPTRSLQTEVIFKWDCPCRVTAERVTPAVLPEDCVCDQSELLSQY